MYRYLLPKIRQLVVSVEVNLSYDTAGIEVFKASHGRGRKKSFDYQRGFYTIQQTDGEERYFIR